MPRLLIVEDDSSVRATIVTFLELEGYTVDAVPSTAQAIEKLNETAYPVVISDVYIDQRTGLDVLNAAKNSNPDCCVILMSARGTMETVMAATRGGAFDYIAKPFELDRILETVKRAEASLEAQEDQTEVEEPPESEMIGSSAGMLEIYKTISLVAPKDATVLIEGETGTGKELVARLIHRYSQRAAGPFAAVDCGSIAPTLLESELFGSLRGSFSGADRDRTGILESAHRGTVFLDEIGEVELGFQLKLLRFLQEREIRPVGAARARQVDVRVVAATNRNLQKLVEEGKFREDLWYRLFVVRLKMPPLRERRGDIPLLANFFLQKYNARYETNARLTDSGVRALEEYMWPGNVRQLQHVVERLSILAPQGRIDGEAVRDTLAAGESRESPVETLEEAEMEQIRRVLAAVGGNKSRAAQVLGIERKTLYRKLERMNRARP
jgi:DNA-binding NtrC family response regulator